MCLGIPGQVVEVLEGYAGQLALVDVQGATRRINLGMLDPDDQQVRSGDWVLIHMGFALERIDEAGAERGAARAGADGLGRRASRRRSDGRTPDTAEPPEPRRQAQGPCCSPATPSRPTRHGYCGPGDSDGFLSSGGRATTRDYGQWPESSPGPGPTWS